MAEAKKEVKVDTKKLGENQILLKQESTGAKRIINLNSQTSILKYEQFIDTKILEKKSNGKLEKGNSNWSVLQKGANVDNILKATKA
jgi:hypothetical protein